VKKRVQGELKIYFLQTLMKLTGDVWTDDHCAADDSDFTSNHTCIGTDPDFYMGDVCAFKIKLKKVLLLKVPRLLPVF